MTFIREQKGHQSQSQSPEIIETDIGALATSTNNNFTRRNGNNGKKRSIRCYKCNNLGHIAGGFKAAKGKNSNINRWDYDKKSAGRPALVKKADKFVKNCLPSGMRQIPLMEMII